MWQSTRASVHAARAPLARIALAMVCAGACAPAVKGEVWIVAPDGSGNAPTVQAAIDLATDGDEILLTDGVFTGDGNRDVGLRGKVLTVRSVSGDPTACILDVQGSAGQPHAGFLIDEGETTASLIADITIRGGHHVGGGSAVDCMSAGITLRGSIFAGNEVNQALRFTSSSTVVEDCIVADNHGGGLWIDGGHCRLVRCVVRGNHALTGAGILSTDADLDVVDCDIIENVAESWGGGVAVLSYSLGTVLVQDSRIERNTTVDWKDFLGGAGVVAVGAGVRFERCDISSNTSAGLGGGVSLIGPGVVLEACRIQGNRADRDDGGALLVQDLYLRGGEATMVDCIVTGNHAASDGGAARVSGLPLFASGCTIAFNEAGERGGALALDRRAELERSVLWQNCAPVGSEIYVMPTSGVPEISCSIADAGGIEPGGAYHFEDVVALDPKFCGPIAECATPSTDGDFSVAVDSPCTPERSPCGEWMGALRVGCADSTPVQRTSWGRLKEVHATGP